MTLGLVAIGVDLARGGGPGGVLLAAAAPSRARGWHRRRDRRTRAGRPSRRGARDRWPTRRSRRRACPRASELYSSMASLADSLARSRRRCSTRRKDPGTGGDQLVEEDRQLPGRLDLDLLPASDLRHGRPGLGLLEVGRGRLEPAGDRRRAVRGAGHGRGRTAGRGRRRASRGRTTGVPRCAGRRRRRSRDGRCGVSRSRSNAAAGDRPAGSRPRSGRDASRSAASSAMTASRLPSPSRSSSWCRPIGGAEDGVVADRAGRSAPRRGRTARRRAGRAPPRAPGEAAAGRGAWSITSGTPPARPRKTACDALYRSLVFPARGRSGCLSARSAPGAPAGQAVAGSATGRSRRAPRGWPSITISMSARVTP